MKKSSNLHFIFFFLCSLAFNGLNAQTEASKPKTEFNPIVTYKVKPNKLDKDGGEITITKDKVKQGLSFFKDLRKQRQEESTSTTQPRQTPPPPSTDTRSDVAAPSQLGKKTPPAQNLAQNPAPANSVNANYSGEWKMKVTMQEKYTNSGQRQDAPGNCEIGMNLKLDGQRLTGEYSWAKGGVCGIAKIEGTMTGANTFEAVITYTGGCCGGAKMKFTGTFLSQDSISGKFKPDGLPGAWCETWWATVKGERE